MSNAVSRLARALAADAAHNSPTVGRPTPADAAVADAAAAVADAPDRLALLPVAHITPDPDQPRKVLGDLDELMASIRHNGVLQPILVTVVAEDAFTIVAGERRWEAARRLGLPTIPALVRRPGEGEGDGAGTSSSSESANRAAAARRLEMQIVENLHRKDLLPIEEAQAYQRLQNEFGRTQDDIARATGRSRVAVNESLRLLQLPPGLLEEGRTLPDVSKSLLLEIARENDEPERQSALFERAVRGTLTVQAVRQERIRRRGGAAAGDATADDVPDPQIFRLPDGVVTVTRPSPLVSVADLLRAALVQETARGSAP